MTEIFAAAQNGWGSSTLVVAYLALFSGVGFVFVFVNLLVGRFLRPANPSPEKAEIYECGEPAIGSSFVQFDLRFYVVALVFIIFDVEVAFLFPWSAVFGKANHLTDANLVVVQADATGEQVKLSADAVGLYRELGVRRPPALVPGDVKASELLVRDSSRKLMLYATRSMAFFFVVLLIGFAYVWRAGALDWVRATVSRGQLAQREVVSGPSTLRPGGRTIPA